MANTQATRKAAKRAVATVKRAAIYIRVSSEPQAKTKGGNGQEAEEKESPKAQERDCRALAEKQGYTVVAVYADTQKYRVGNKMVEPSGTRADRPGLRQMLADARAGLFDVILAWREDRLYRSYRPMLDVLDCLEETGLDIELAKENFDKNLAPVKAWAARMELNAKHDRQMMGMAGRFEQGKAWPAILPYGLQIVKDRYAVNEAEAECVRLVWQWFGDGVSLNDIRQRLITSGAKQRGKPSKYVWSFRVIRAILSHNYYHTGDLPIDWNGKTYTVPVPVIVDAETAAKVKARFARYKAYPAGNLRAGTLTAGLVYCQKCNTRMSIHSNKHGAYHFLECNNHHSSRNTVDGCAKSVSLTYTDDEVWRKVWEVITDPVKFEARVRAALAEKQAQEVDAEAECQRLQAKLDELALERQTVYTWARKKQISDDDMGQQLAAIWIEESEAKRELANNRLLVGDRAERFIAVAMDYRERLVKGAQVNFDPKTEEEKQALFAYKRWVVQGTVKRVDVLADKTIKVKMEFDDKMLEGEPLPVEVNISDTLPNWCVTDTSPILYRICLTL